MKLWPHLKRHPIAYAAGGGVLLLALAADLAAQAPASPAAAAAPAPVATPAVPAQATLTLPGAARKPLATASAKAPGAPTQPEWHTLTAAQQQALKPLAVNWPVISERQKRKWLAISQNFASLPQAEQARLHERMTEWVALSNQERQQARLNFAGARTLTADERLAKWQAYQALSDEQKKQLADTGPGKLQGAAIAVKPVPAQKLASVPTPLKATGTNDPAAPRHTPKIAAAPHQVDHNTLLPQQVPVSESLSAHP